VNSEPFHIPVLLHEVLDLLVTDPAGVYVDATVGGGGHAEKIAEKLTDGGRLIGFDADADALAEAASHLARFGGRIALVHANFRNLKDELRRLQVGSFHGILLDLGVSSFQLDEGPRGFSYRSDDPLDMRMDRRQALTAHDIVNTYAEKNLTELLLKYGEERASRRIARRVISLRPVETTGQLVAAVESVVGTRFLPNVLSRVFQALRIAVNDELRGLSQALTDAIDLLDVGGRIVVISYHSLEDRIVKDFFRAEAAERIASGHKYLPDSARTPRLRVLTRKPVVAGERELVHNRRARSAKLRAAERCGA
jgi:16S rRNA (cytosine1402-N4)-methyltransferase